MARKSKYGRVEQADRSAKRIYHAGIYLRLSDATNEEMERSTLAVQRMICLDYLQGKEDIVPCHTYVDNGYTGGNFKRPDFQRMLSDIQSGYIDCVVVKDLSRFGRNYIEVDNYLSVQFPAMGVRFISIGEHYDSALAGCEGEDNSLMIALHNILNEHYIRDISSKTRSIVYSKMDEGTYLPASSVVPYGYLRDPKHNTYQVDKECAAVVQRIFEMRSKGISFKMIAQTLTDEGVPTPSQSKYDIHGGYHYASKWKSDMIRKIASNQTYLGHRIHKPRYLEANQTTVKDSSEWKIAKNAHEAIISQELFDVVQAQIKPYSHNGHILTDDMEFEDDCRPFLTGKVLCGDCGAIMQSRTAKAHKRGIEKTVLIFQGQCHHQRRISHRWVYRAVSATVKSQLNGVDELLLMKKTLQASKHSGAYQMLMRKKRSVQLKVHHASGWLERLFEDYLSGLLDREEYLFAKQKYRQNYDELVSEEQKINQEIEDYQSVIASAQKWILDRELFDGEEKLTHELIAHMVSEVKVFPRFQLEITLSYQDIFDKLKRYTEEDVVL